MDEKEPNTSVKITPNGPLLIKGSFELVGSNGALVILTEAQLESGVWICRCGKSKNQPFCDGSHAK